LETQFPREITELKDKITTAKNTTAEYEDKTRILAEELRRLK